MGKTQYAFRSEAHLDGCVLATHYNRITDKDGLLVPTYIGSTIALGGVGEPGAQFINTHAFWFTQMVRGGQRPPFEALWGDTLKGCEELHNSPVLMAKEATAAWRDMLQDFQLRSTCADLATEQTFAEGAPLFIASQAEIAGIKSVNAIIGELALMQQSR